MLSRGGCPQAEPVCRRAARAPGVHPSLAWAAPTPATNDRWDLKRTLPDGIRGDLVRSPRAVPGIQIGASTSLTGGSPDYGDRGATLVRSLHMAFTGRFARAREPSGQ